MRPLSGLLLMRLESDLSLILVFVSLRDFSFSLVFLFILIDASCFLSELYLLDSFFCPLR